MSPIPRWTLPRRAIYRFFRVSLGLALRVLYRHRTFTPERIPASGGVLIVCNHQSYLDPLALGCRVRRPINFVARSGLFRVPGLGWLIRAFGATPIREDGNDTRAMRTVLALLDAGCAVALFPEGSRTSDGRMAPFKRGLISIVRRARCPVVPVAVEGCFDAWARSRPFPRLLGARVASMVDPPVASEELLADGPDAALERLEGRIDEMRLELRARLRASTRGRYPPPGPGDSPSCAPGGVSASGAGAC